MSFPFRQSSFPEKLFSMSSAPSLSLLAASLFLAAASPGASPPSPIAISFSSAVSRALAKNPTVLVAREETRRAAALVEEARAAALPALSASTSYTNIDHNREFGGVIFIPQNQLIASLSLALPLAVPRAWVGWAHAQDNASVARRGEADARRQLAVAAAKAWLALLAQHRVVEVTRDAVANARAHDADARARLSAGWGNRVDVARAASALASDEAQDEAARSALTRLQEALGVLVGEDRPLDARVEPTLPEAPSLADALASARSRPDVALAEERLTAARHVARDTWAEYVPFLTGLGLPYYTNPPTPTQPEFGYEIQLVLSWPIYEGGLRGGEGRERDALVAEARDALDGALRQAASDVRAAEDVLARARRSLASAEEAAREAADARRLTALAYKAGAGTNLEVVDAETTDLYAQTTAVVAEDAVREAQLDLLYAAGRFP